jgi:hypothetical protein
MTQKFLIIPSANLDGNGQPNNLTGAILDDASVAGLTASTGYRAFALNNFDDFTTTAAALSFADSEVATTFSSASWGSRTLVDGWWEAPSVSARADSNSGHMALPPAAVLTFTVDIASLGTVTTVNFRANSNGTAVQSLIAVNTSSWTLSSGTGGVINMGGGVYRAYGKITVVTAAARFFLDYPTSANANVKLRNPAVFYQDLTVQQITDLV